ncbi:hypothetical protein Pcinc_043761 [Petrolisthes cinctipes]|uniref:Uncharacterized protein n=1 Tax=Petrolisthes cinctipes TaxID=88211 RepID=A0AAE1BF06_PETCI|nr:hypothetical protein Pcinc_043761 [Petrolisthes cinctipes]
MTHQNSPASIQSLPASLLSHHTCLTSRLYFTSLFSVSLSPLPHLRFTTPASHLYFTSLLSISPFVSLLRLTSSLSLTSVSSHLPHLSPLLHLSPLRLSTRHSSPSSHLPLTFTSLLSVSPLVTLLLLLNSLSLSPSFSLSHPRLFNQFSSSFSSQLLNYVYGEIVCKILLHH